MRSTEIRQAHERYNNALDRFCEAPFIVKSNKTIWGSLEAHGRRLMNKTIISTISDTKDTLDDLNTKRVIDFYVSNLYRLPHPKTVCLNYDEMIRNAKTTDDYKYLKECEEDWKQLMTRVTAAPVKDMMPPSAPVVLYYGPVGTSGYASVCRDLVSAIGKYMPVYFDIIQFHNYEPDALADNAELLARSVRADDPVYPHIVICHSTPELWPTIRRRHPNALLYGITVWETNRIPRKWELSLQVADIVTTPSKFSTDAFLAAGFKENFVQTVTHPVVLRRSIDALILDSDLEIHPDARFYCIAENSNRKGIRELLEVWRQYVAETPNGTDRFLLKTSSSVLTEYADALANLPRFDLITRRISDADIHKIHVSCSVYVTCAKAEGQGLGACHAVLYGNRVVALKYGGLCDYISKCNYIKCTKTEPATLCSRSHIETCALMPACRDFDLITPYSMHWASPDIAAFVKELKKPLSKPKAFAPAKRRIVKKFSLEARGAAFTKSILSAYKRFVTDPGWRSRTKYNNAVLQAAVDPPLELQKDTIFADLYKPRAVHIFCGDARLTFTEELRNTIFLNLAKHFDTLDFSVVSEEQSLGADHLVILGQIQPSKEYLKYKNIYIVNGAFSEYMVPFIEVANFASFNGMEDAFNALTYNPVAKFEPDLLYLAEPPRASKRKTPRTCLVVALKDAEDVYETQINMLRKEEQIKDRTLDVIVVSNKTPPRNKGRDWHYIKPSSPKIMEFLPKAKYLLTADKGLVAVGHVHQVPNIQYVRNAYDNMDDDSFMTSVYYRSVKVIDSIRQCLSNIECPGKFQEIFNTEPDSERNRLISLIHNACSGTLPVSLLQSWSTANLWKYALNTS